MTNSTTQPTSLTIVTVATSEPPEAGIREAGPIQAIKSLFVGKEDVPIQRIHTELARVQSEVDDVLSKIDQEVRHGFQLSEVEVSLGISASGTIGFVSAGVEAGISLTFSRAGGTTSD